MFAINTGINQLSRTLNVINGVHHVHSDYSFKIKEIFVEKGKKLLWTEIKQY